MPEPTLQDIHVDAALTDFTQAYFLENGNYVAPSVFPITNVPKKSGNYFVYDRNQLLRSDAAKRAPNTEAPVRGYGLSKDTYNCEVYSVAVDVSEQERANADPALDPEEDAARVTVQDIKIKMDREWTNEAFSTGIWGTESTATWTSSTGDVVGDLQTAILTVMEDTGYRPNTLVLGPESWYQGLWTSTQVVDRLPDNSPRIITESFIGELFGFERVFILNGVEFTGDQGTTGDPSFIHEDHALVCYTDPMAGLRTATAGKTFVWSGLVGAGNGIRTKRLDLPWKDAQPRVETDVAFDYKIVAADMGYLLKNVAS